MKFFDYNDKVIRSRIIYENECVFSILTYTPIVPGHTLIIPKRHIRNYDQLKDEEHKAIVAMQILLKSNMEQTFGATGFNYARNEGSDAGQTVVHLHIHMLPRKKGDSGIYDYEPRQFLYRPGSREVSPQDELKAITELLRNSKSNNVGT